MKCPACGVESSGNYCPNCGQRANPHVLSVRALLRDLLDEQLNLNATLPRTLRALFFKPGFLTHEYLRQRISPYVPPFRLYLGMSVLFFLLVTLKAQRQELILPDQAVLDSLLTADRDSTNARLARGQGPPFRFGIFFDPRDSNWAANAQVNFGNERVNRAVKSHLLTLRYLPPEEALRGLMRGVIEDAPKVMFLLLPLYALLLKLLYVRSGRYYMEHFVFALHGHAFAFGVFVLMLALRSFAAATGLLLIWVLAYFWFAMRRVYQESWVWTTVKWAVLGQVYLLVVALALAAAVVGTVITL